MLESSGNGRYSLRAAELSASRNARGRLTAGRLASACLLGLVAGAHMAKLNDISSPWRRRAYHLAKGHPAQSALSSRGKHLSARSR